MQDGQDAQLPIGSVGAKRERTAGGGAEGEEEEEEEETARAAPVVAAECAASLRGRRELSRAGLGWAGHALGLSPHCGTFAFCTELAERFWGCCSVHKAQLMKG